MNASSGLRLLLYTVCSLFNDREVFLRIYGNTEFSVAININSWLYWYQNIERFLELDEFRTIQERHLVWMV